jgi:hypothetical protein
MVGPSVDLQAGLNVGMRRKQVGLALGGGAARDLAHIGVLQWLERELVPLDCIAGTSVGSLVGAEVVIAADLMLPLGRRPKGLLEVARASIRYLIAFSGDDPATADVQVGFPLWGIGSLLRILAGSWPMALGRQATEEALPAIRAALAS